MKSSILILTLLTTFTALAEDGPTNQGVVQVDAQCITDMIAVLDQTIVSPIKTAMDDRQKEFLKEAVSLTQKQYIEKMDDKKGLVERKVLSRWGSSLVAYVNICDDLEDGQGNCLETTFKEDSKTGKPALISAKEDWHMPPGKAYFFCEDK